MFSTIIYIFVASGRGELVETELRSTVFTSVEVEFS